MTELEAYKEKVRDLAAQLESYREKEAAIKQAIRQMADSLGIAGIEDPSQIAARIIGQVPKLMMEYTVNKPRFEQRFLFLKDLLPIITENLKENEDGF
jgi:hypothetical protein